MLGFSPIGTLAICVTAPDVGGHGEGGVDPWAAWKKFMSDDELRRRLQREDEELLLTIL